MAHKLFWWVLSPLVLVWPEFSLKEGGEEPVGSKKLVSYRAKWLRAEILASDQWFSVVAILSPRGHVVMSAGTLLASSVWRPGMMLSLSQHPGQLPQPQLVPPQASMVPKLRSPESGLLRPSLAFSVLAACLGKLPELHGPQSCHL